MNAMRNLVHIGVIGLWAVVGTLFTLKCLFGGSAGLATVWAAASWWLWFAALLGLTTWLVTRWQSALAALAVHGAVFFVLMSLPRYLPFSLLRLGFDLVRGTV